MGTDRIARARWIALIVPAALIAGAYGFQYIGHLYPCEMCWWQRYPQFAAIVFALAAFVVPARASRLLIVCAALAIFLSGAIGVFHAGVEYHWWQGFTECTSTMAGHGGSVDDMLARIMKAPVVRCDVPQWTLFGISLAGFNALVSIPAALVILALLPKGKR
ncbi:disulfide bond formation protein [Sphingomonas panacis]|uniref:Disulfide bond formation protein n=1 Tax=Sphingomonas panacis TaxID=1560345 RepID=A0A1B3Z6H6_9SPHN|nr:disulfide bond formation protein B [Sphingomonas panacis]AOH83023.1 disulfide bond formation protein [Sphingomonas panacis]